MDSPSESKDVVDLVWEQEQESPECVEVSEEELTERYSARRKLGDAMTGVRLYRPDDSEIVERYWNIANSSCAGKGIVLNYPNDDVLVERFSPSCRETMIKKRDLDDVEDFGSEYFPNLDDSADSLRRNGSSVCSSSDRDNLDRSDGWDSEPIDDQLSNEEDSGADSVYEDPEESTQYSDDAHSRYGELVRRSLPQPSCSSRHSPNITVYNLCCDKEFVSSISIDASKGDSLLTRRISRRDFRDLLATASQSDAFHGVHDRRRTVSNKTPRAKLSSRHDSFLNVVLAMERMARGVESRCKAARRSLRKNHSHGSVLRTGAKLKKELTPLLKSQLALSKTLRIDVVL